VPRPLRNVPREQDQSPHLPSIDLAPLSTPTCRTSHVQVGPVLAAFVGHVLAGERSSSSANDWWSRLHRGYELGRLRWNERTSACTGMRPRAETAATAVASAALITSDRQTGGDEQGCSLVILRVIHPTLPLPTVESHERTAYRATSPAAGDRLLVDLATLLPALDAPRSHATSERERETARRLPRRPMQESAPPGHADG
jgi:hypothetical protein